MRLGGDRGRAPGPSLIDAGEPLALSPVTGEKEPAGLDEAAVQGQTGYGHLWCRLQISRAKARKQVAQAPDGAWGQVPALA